MEFSSDGLFMDVFMNDGSIIEEVIVCPDPEDRENVTLLEKYNGDVIRVRTEDIERLNVID